MKLQRKGTRHSHRGVIGVESAIVMIAFVIVAAALAFVVLNMGFTTTQKAKTATLSSLEESSSTMKISGTITAVGCIDIDAGCTSIQRINATTIPLKISQSGNAVNFSPELVSISYLGKSIQFNNIYAGPITVDTFRQSVLAFRQADLETDSTFDAFNGANPVNGTLPSETTAFVYWSKRQNLNQVLELGEHATLAVAFASDDRPRALDKISLEIIVSNGATLTIERHIPNITHKVVDLG
ncbi:archaellin/type IV pilin N-terminal domain-containing protein [Nitrosopumilus ureiphilus]|jgi:archaeal flagellin FlaB|uniref:Flagellin n=1 Tax=Nitrosopumilus ureiphilus TaxID=1470067 RepID=A0A7D5R1U7_9ARCH|nr:archaellin/type IV pilin N-terminal domain-containing protein [Nitrosopumilus ureiphilus]QLH06876.1 flagellin [Nitrosopumilus ureiphilus]